MLNVTYAECHIQALDAECHYADCHYAECRGALYNIHLENCYNHTTVKSFIFQRFCVFKHVWSGASIIKHFTSVINTVL
jgi:hypothetical protein